VIGIALFFVFLGFFEGIGYHVYQISETSFVPDPRLGYATASFAVNMSFNPITFPFYWIMGTGSISGNISMRVLPESFERGDFVAAKYGLSPADRYGKYISFLTSWGLLQNFLVLVLLGIILDVLKSRVLYVSLLVGAFGFLAADTTGIQTPQRAATRTRLWI